jgi:hypothetical protein
MQRSAKLIKHGRDEVSVLDDALGPLELPLLGQEGAGKRNRATN